MSSVVQIENFNAANITISAPKTLDSGAKQAYLNYEGQKFIMQSATNMAIPFGLGVYDKSGPVEYSVELSFRGNEQRADVKKFLDVMTEIDNRLIDEGVKNSRTWFKSDMKREIVNAFYSPCVRYAKDNEGNIKPYPPTLKLKLRKIGADFETKFYDVKGNLYRGVPIEDLLVKGAQVTALMECAGVWFAGSKFGLTWRAKQIVIHKLPEKLQDFAFKFEGSTATEESAVVPSRSSKSAPPAPAQQVEEEEEEDNEEIDDDEVLAPPPAAVKKPSVLAAVLPQPVQQTVNDDEGDDIEPVAAPKKTTIKKKPVALKK